MSQVFAALPFHHSASGIANGIYGPTQIETSTRGMKITVARPSEIFVCLRTSPMTTASSR